MIANEKQWEFRKNRKHPAARIFRTLAVSWLAAAAVEYLGLPGEYRDLSGLEGLRQMSFPRVVLLTLLGILFWKLVSLLADIGRLQRWILAALFGLLGGGAVSASFSWPFLGFCLTIMGILLVCAIRGWDGREASAPIPEQPCRRYGCVTAVGAGAFFLFVCLWTGARVFSFSTPSFDFGIFSQMFSYMEKTGLPLTTLERDGLLSHFRVHVSPIYYLLLPIYALAPTPATLQVCQGAVLASGVIPLWKLGRPLGLRGAERMGLCFLLLLYPAYAGGTGYDLHENCFLTPLLLWVFYGIQAEKPLITGLAAVLTLMVKEDAGIYVAVIGLWLLVRTWLRPCESGRHSGITGGALLTGSVLWFLLVLRYLDSAGEGVMTDRYSNFIYDGSGSLLTAVKAVLMNPMKAVYKCAHGEKLKFLGLTMGALAALPLCTRRYERFILLIPYLLVNLMSDYPYQHDIFFQYTFGSTAFLLYLTAANLGDWKGSRRAAALAAALAVSGICFGTTVVPKAETYISRWVQNEDHYDRIRRVLDTIPPEASVTASTFYTTYLSRREILHDLKYCSREHLLESQYVVIALGDDMRAYGEEGKDNENLIRLLEENGFTQWEALEGTLVVYKQTGK